MAKTLRTSGDYNIKAGSGAAGTNTIKLDSKHTRITGDLTVDGSQTTLNVTNTTIEDQFIELNRNNSTAGVEDSGIVFNGGSGDNAILYFDASANEFAIATTSTNFQDGSTTKFEVATGNLTYRNIHVNASPSATTHAASKAYVDAQTSGGFTLRIAGDDSALVTVGTGNTLQFTGANGISTAATEPDTVTISLGNNLTNINSIDTGSSNGDLILRGNGTGNVVIDDTLTFSANASDPTATAQTIVYNKTAGGGGTGLYFRNSNISSGEVGELISKKKATALAIALG